MNEFHIPADIELEYMLLAFKYGELKKINAAWARRCWELEAEVDEWRAKDTVREVLGGKR